MTSSLGGIEMVLPDGRTYRPTSSVYRDDDNMTDTEYFRSSYEHRFQQQEEAAAAADSAVPCPEDFERNVNISDCTSFLDTQRMDRDKIEESLSLVGFLFTLFSLIIFVLDTGSDIALTYFLFKSKDEEEKGQWFRGTAIIVISSALIVNFLSLKWYVPPHKQPEHSETRNTRKPFSLSHTHTNTQFLHHNRSPDSFSSSHTLFSPEHPLLPHISSANNMTQHARNGQRAGCWERAGAVTSTCR